MAGQRWTKGQLDDWLAQGSPPGLAHRAVDVVEIPSGDPRVPKKTARQITYTRNDGQVVTVLDTGETTKVDAFSAAEGVQAEPIYEVLEEGKEPEAPARDTRSPEARANEQELDRQRRANQQETGNWETDADRRTRERQEAADAEARARQARQAEIDARQAEIAAGNLDVSRGSLTVQQQAEQRARDAEAARQASQTETNALNREKFQYEREKDVRDASKPTFLGQATDTNANIAYFDPVTGEVKGAPNPMYDAVKAEAARKREELNLQIQLGRLQADQAAAEYQRWFKQNVEVPFMQAAERRAQAQERRAALQAEEQRRQFAAQEARQRRAMGLQAGQAAVQAEVSLLPYRVGPQFGQQFGSAITSLAQGGSLANNAAAGINFTKEAFEFDRPDFKAISNAAMKDALKGLTDYQPAEGEFATPDYSGITFPDAASMASAPTAPSGLPSYESIVNSIPYQPQS